MKITRGNMVIDVSEDQAKAHIETFGWKPYVEKTNELVPIELVPESNENEENE